MPQPHILQQRRASVPITADLLLGVLAFFIPPFTVFVKLGVSVDLLLNVILTLFGAIPGIIHAWYIVLKYPDDGVPYLSDWTRRQSIISPVNPGDERSGVLGNFGPFSRFTAGSHNGYNTISTDDDDFDNQGGLPGGYSRVSENDLETGTIPQKSTSPSSHGSQHPQQQGSYPAAGNSSGGAGPSSSDNQPPPYDGQAPKAFVPGDNKIQYGAQF